MPNENRKASSGAAKPLSASVRSTSRNPSKISAFVSLQLTDRLAVADAVPQLRERELHVEHEVRVAQPERHLRVFEVIEVRRAGELVAALAVACSAAS